MRDIPVGLLEGGLEVVAHGILVRGQRWRHVAGRSGRRQAELQHVCADGIPVGQKRHPLHDVRELANVPRPGIVQKPCFGVLGKPLGS